MSNAQHTRSRSKDLIRITRDYLEETGRSEMGFSKLLWTNYLSMVKNPYRTLDIHKWVGPFDHENEKIISKQYTRFLRYMDGTVNLPVDVEEAWVEALEGPYRSNAIQVLCGRYKIIPVDLVLIPDAQRASLCIESFSHFVGQLGKMLADGVIDEKDIPYLEELDRTGKTLVAEVSNVLHAARVKTGAGEGNT